MLSTISKNKKQITVTEFMCSDGRTFLNPEDANQHEMHKHIKRIFGEGAFHGNKGGVKRYFISRNSTLECGVYRVVANNDDDMETLDHFFPYIDEQLGFPENFPIEIDIEIYYDDIKEAVNKHAMWRLYKKSN